MSEIKNSEILFLYDAKNCNPNGDMDDENKPRMDKATKTNLVSDVRLKRYIRDYLHDFKDLDIFVIQTDKSKDAKQRSKELKGWENVKKLIDVKLFGTISTEEKKANNITGPIQFNWGYSLNRVDLIKSNTITSHFKTSGNEENEGGAGIGKDFRVKYSLIAFSGSINKKNAEKTGLSEEDLKLFDEAVLKSIPLLRTRSKIGQWPRLYLRVELKDDAFLKDLRELIHLNKIDEINDISEVELDLSDLIEYLENNKKLIEKIKLFKDPNLKLFKNGEEIEDFKRELKNICEAIEELELNGTD